MALIKCPECGKPVSSKALACPSCGFDVRHRHWYSKKWGQYLIILTILFIIFSCYSFHRKTKGLVEEINQVVKEEVIKDYKLESIQKNYNKLNTIEKLFVYNYYELKNIPVEVTSNNLKKYIDIKIAYSNYSYEDNSFLGLIDKYKEYVTMDINIKSKGKYKFENIKFNLDLNNGYVVKKTGEHLEITLNEDGEYKGKIDMVNDGLLNNSITSELKMPSVELDKISLKNVSGYIKYK